MVVRETERTAPKSCLRLEWIYGYRGAQCRNNLWYTGTRDIVYFIAGAAVVYNVREHKQRFYLGHSDDILCLTMHSDKLTVATGQIGKQPCICVWDSTSLKTVSIMKESLADGVAALAFDKTGNRLVSAGIDANSTIIVWDWRKGKPLASVQGHSDRVFDVRFSPNTENLIVSCGVKHIKFWTLSGNALDNKPGVFGDTGDLQTLTCLEFGGSTPNSETVYAGTLGGQVYAFRDAKLVNTIAANPGGVLSIAKSDAISGFVTGGRDGQLRFYDPDFKPLNTINFHESTFGYDGLTIRSVCWRQDDVLVGTEDSEVIEISTKDRKPTVLLYGHAEGELWALATHPKQPQFATGSDDQTLRIWSTADNALLIRASLPQKIRSLAYNEDGSHLACGLTDGSFVVFRSKDLNQIAKVQDRKETVHEMKYSADGRVLAAGSNDGFVDLYDVGQKYKKLAEIRINDGLVVHLDWSSDGRAMQIMNEKGDRYVFRLSLAPGGGKSEPPKPITDPKELATVRWATYTCVKGPEVAGIWEKYAKATDVNSVDADFGHEVMVTGDDFGLVRLYKFPSLKQGAKFRKYVGHSADVTNVRFTHDKMKVVTTGGADHAIFQWRFIPEGIAGDSSDIEGDDQAQYTDTNTEGSDSDLSDVPAIDSDVEKERRKTYNRPVAKEDMAKLKPKLDASIDPKQKRKEAPVDSLVMQYAFGYRCFDARNNIFYLQTGEIVFHTAAVGVVLNKETRKMRFYTQHTDDIICLALHPQKDWVATGQVGKNPPIHVWDVESGLKNMVILKDAHERGVCAVDFSADGKKLASIGLDDNHTMQIWDWRKGEKLASARTSGDKIFVVKFSPFDANKAVTVGMKHIRFWSQAGASFTSNRGTFGNVAPQDSFFSVAHGKDADTVFAGGTNNVYHFQAAKLLRVVKAHEGPIFAMFNLANGFVTGGKDGNVSLFDDNFGLLKTYPIKKVALAPGGSGTLLEDSPPVRSAVLGPSSILVGTLNGEVLEIEKTGPIRVLVNGHMEGELWGLATHPSKYQCATCSDDMTVRLWDFTEDACRMLNAKRFKKALRCCDYSPDGRWLAVGFKDGSFSVLNVDTLDETVTFAHHKRDVSQVRFSPDPSKWLAVGSHDLTVDIYNLDTKQRTGTCSGVSGTITHLDWDVRGKLLQVNSAAKEVLYFEVPSCKRYTIHRDEVEKLVWSTWTCILGQQCDGIWPPRADVTDVNAANASHDRRIIATGDDSGYVKLFLFPAKGKFAKYKQYNGHSSHVTNVRFSYDDAYLVSTGGADTSVIVWKRLGPAEKQQLATTSTVVGAPTAAMPTGESEEEHTDMEEEPNYDSDVQMEKAIDYTQMISVEPIIGNSNAVKPHLQQKAAATNQNAGSKGKKSTQGSVSRGKVDKPNVSSARSGDKQAGRAALAAAKPNEVNDLELVHIYGYRGYDARNNLHYLEDGNCIVYHAAGACVVHDLSSGTQRFFLEHTDDILCLTLNRHPKYKDVVASGQIGEVPRVIVWNAQTRKVLSKLLMPHGIGVCAVDFSCSGKLLLTMGVDKAHTLCVWRWEDGTCAAKADGHTMRLFVGEFRPDSDSLFVTVGIKHVRFWNVAGNQLTSKRGVILKQNTPNAKTQTMLCVSFGANNVTFTGSMSGDVYVWQDYTLSRVVSKVHTGPVFSLYTSLKDGLIVSGGKEKSGVKDNGPVKLWDPEMKRCRSFTLETDDKIDVAKSVCRNKGKILVGTKGSEIIELNEKTGQNVTIVRGHSIGKSDGDLWGLAVHPAQDRFATASDDETCRIWDYTNKVMLQKLQLGGPGRSCAYSPDGETLAIGLKSGEFLVINAGSLKLITRKRDRNSPVTDIKFSPDGKYLAVGTQEKCIDFYDMQWNKAGFCKGIAGAVIQMDFSVDSHHVRVSTDAYKLQVFALPAGDLVADDATLKKIVWSAWTTPLGDEVVGVWAKDGKQGDVNCTDLSKNGKSLVTGDDFGFVKLFNFPCPEKFAAFKAFNGHSAHVTNIKFTRDDSFVLSDGGDDCCVFQWRCT